MNPSGSLRPAENMQPTVAVEQHDRVGRVLHEGAVAGLVDLGVALRLAAGEQRREDPDDGAQHADRVVVPGAVAHDAVEADEPAELPGVHQRHRDDGADALALELDAFAAASRLRARRPAGCGSSDRARACRASAACCSSATACWVWISGLMPGAHHSCVFVIIVRSSVTVKTYARSTAAASPSSASAWLMRLVDRVRVGVDEAGRDRRHRLVQDPDVAQRLFGLAALGDVADRQDDAADLVD